MQFDSAASHYTETTMTTKPLEKLLPPNEAAAYLGNQPQTLAVWRSSGRYGLPFVRVGRAIRYRESDLKSWIEQRTTTSVTAAK